MRVSAFWRVLPRTFSATRLCSTGVGRADAPTSAAGRARWAVLAVFLALAPAGWGEPNGVYREVYTGLSGNSLASLTNDSNFPNFPTSTEILTNLFEAP